MVDQISARRIRKIVIDIFCLLLVSIPIALIYLLAKPYRRGFFCDDQTLMYPYMKSSINGLILIVLCWVLPIVVIIIVEGVKYKFRMAPDDRFIIGKLNVNRFWVNVYKYTGLLQFTIIVTLFLTFVLKYYTGRLRPHFFDVCKPDYAKFNCSTGYILTEDICTGNDTAKLLDARQAFPSGHASVAFSSLSFLSIYIQSRMTWNGSILIKHILQIIFMSTALVSGLSRVTDNKHHWSDVLAGFVLGGLVALGVAASASDLIIKHRKFRCGNDTEADISNKNNTCCSANTFATLNTSHELQVKVP